MCVSRSRMVIGRLAGTIDAAARAGHRHGGRGERRHEPADRIGEAQPAFFHERQHGGAGDGLGLRRDAEDRVHGHRAAGFLVAPADGAFVDRLAVAQHQRHGAGEPLLVHVALQQRVDAPQALDGEARRAWRRRPATRRAAPGRAAAPWGARQQQAAMQADAASAWSISGFMVAILSRVAAAGRGRRIVVQAIAAPSSAFNMRFSATMR